jgi:hypothetical protein
MLAGIWNWYIRLRDDFLQMSKMARHIMCLAIFIGKNNGVSLG